jgi:hypothetical protein
METFRIWDIIITAPPWVRSYMQIFWFDLREKFGDVPDIWAVSSNCNTGQCYIFKYEEKFNTKRTLKHTNTWNFGHNVKGIDVLDLNSSTVDAGINDLRCPPIFVDVARGDNRNGINGDFWCLADTILFHNILKRGGTPVCTDFFGYHKADYNPLDTYDPKKLINNTFGKRSAEIKWGGICGGGVTALGTYNNTNTPTWSYYTMASRASILNESKSNYSYKWAMSSAKHTFEYDSSHNLFKKVMNGSGSIWDFSKRNLTDLIVPSTYENMFRSCQTILFDCRGPVVNLGKDNKLNILGRGINGNYIAPPARTFFEGKDSRGANCFIGEIMEEKSNKGTLVGEYNKFEDKEKNDALRDCDSQGRQVLAIFLGYPPTALQEGKACRKVEVGINFLDVESHGLEIGSGVNTQWSAGHGGKDIRFGLASWQVGFAKKVDKLLTMQYGDKEKDNIEISKPYDTADLLDEGKNNGIIFFDAIVPNLVAGLLVWDKDTKVTVTGWHGDNKQDYDIIPATTGVIADKTGKQLYATSFDLYKAAEKLDSTGKTCYSPLSDGLENKNKAFNIDKNNNPAGNLFLFEKELDLENKIKNASKCNYKFLADLIKYANGSEDIKVSPNNTFQDRPVKWLSATDPGKKFGYDFKYGKNYQMDFEKFTNRTDSIDEGHGGYFQFEIGGSGSQGSRTAQSKFQTSTSTSTTKGYKFFTPQVDASPSLKSNYTIKFWGFNINPRAYKEMMVNNNLPVDRPDYIPEYCWDRNQSFALFVPEIVNSFKTAER